MEFTFIEEDINAVIIDNFYSDSQLTEIFGQLSELTNEKYMSADKDKLEAAVDVHGDFITTKFGVWLEDGHSPILKHCIENFSSKEVFDKFVGYNSLFRIMFHLNRRFNLLSYYENSGYYSKHTDVAVFTVLNYFHKEPKQFSGGEIVLHSPDFSKKITVEPRNNRVIVIPSHIVHEVLPVTMRSKILSGNGRYCMSIFMTAEDVKELRKI